MTGTPAAPAARKKQTRAPGAPAPAGPAQFHDPLRAREIKTSGHDGDPTPLGIHKYGVEMPWVGKVEQIDAKGRKRKRSTELGYLRDSRLYWQEYARAYPDHFSDEQRARALAGHAPVIDDHWADKFKEHAQFKGERLEHHHVGQGSFAVPLPHSVHKAHSVFHADSAVVASRKKPFSQQEIDDQEKRVTGRQQKKIDLQEKKGRFKAWGTGGKAPRVAGQVPLASQLAGVPEDELGPQPGAAKRFKPPARPATPLADAGSAAAAAQAATHPPAAPPVPPQPRPAAPPAAPVVHPAAPAHPPPPPHHDEPQHPAAPQHPAPAPPPPPPKRTPPGKPAATPAHAAPPSQAAHPAPPLPPERPAPPQPAHSADPDDHGHAPGHGPQRSLETSHGGGLLLGTNERGVQGHAGFAAHQRSASGYGAGLSMNIGGKMWAKAEEVPLSSPPRYRVTVTVDLTADAGISADKEGQHGAAGINAAIGAQLTWSTTTPEISAEEMKVYMGSLQAGSGNAPEFNLARLISTGRIPDAKAYVATLKGRAKSAEAAARSPEGESATFTQGTHGSLGAQVSRGPVGIEVSISKSKQLQITRTKKNGQVYISISIIGETGKTIGGSFNSGLAGFGLHHSMSVSQSRGATFVLKPDAPDFQARYDALMAVDTVEDLARQVHGNKPVEEITGQGTSHETGVKGTVAGVGFAYGEGGSLTQEDIRNADGSVVHRVEGTGSGNAAIVAGDKTIAKYSQVDTFSGEVGSDNVGTGETRTARSETDLAKSASGFYDALKKDTWGTIAGLPKGQTPILREKNDAEGKFLEDDAFEHLYQLAQDAHAWSKHCNRGQDLAEWNRLGVKIAHSDGKRATIQALMASFESKGADRNKYINQAVGLSGESYKFPDSIADLEPIYRELVRGNPIAHANQLLQEGKNTEATAELNGATTKLNEMLKKIREHSADFEQNPEAYAAMQEAISTRLGELRTATRKAVPPPPKPAPFIGPPTLEQAQAQAQPDEAELKKQDLEAEINLLVGTCQGNRKDEGERFASIRGEFAKDSEPWYKFSKSDIYAINNTLSRLKELYARWDVTLDKLRAKYEAHGESPDKANAYKPDWGTYNELHRKANGAIGGY